MVRKLMLMVLLSFFSAHAYAQHGYIGLFGDAQHLYYGYCPAEGWHSIEMWIWCLPGQQGQMCAEFSVDYAADLIQSTVTWNGDLISVSLGTLPDGFSVCYKQCQYNWHWIGHQTIWVAGNTPGILRVAAHPEAGEYRFTNCLYGFPVEPCWIYTDLYYNDPCPPGG